MPRILCILVTQLVRKVCNQNLEHTELVNLEHFVCAILEMALLCSDFGLTGFFLRSTTILGRQVVLQLFHLKCCEHPKNLKLVDGSVFPSGLILASAQVWPRVRCLPQTRWWLQVSCSRPRSDTRVNPDACLRPNVRLSPDARLRSGARLSPAARLSPDVGLRPNAGISPDTRLSPIAPLTSDARHGPVPRLSQSLASALLVASDQMRAFAQESSTSTSSANSQILLRIVREHPA